jgi:hypothetical protein
MIRAALTMLVLIAAGCQQPATERTSVAELLSTPDRFSGKQVRVAGYWLKGFEWSLLKTEPESQDASIWCELEMDGRASLDLALAMEKARKQSGIPSALESLTWIDCVGVFENRMLTEEDKAGVGQRGFGHLGKHPNQLRIQKIISYRVLKLPPSPE